MQTGDRTVYKVAQKWEECLGGPEMARRDVHMRRKQAAGKRIPFSQKTGMHFPFEASIGKCIPF